MVLSHIVKHVTFWVLSRYPRFSDTSIYDFDINFCLLVLCDTVGTPRIHPFNKGTAFVHFDQRSPKHSMQHNALV